MSKAKLNKVLAGMLAATMVLGMSMTAFATETTPVKNGSTTGSGEFEGHVEKSVLLVNLPTVAESANTFKYTMDPEGLIAATEGAKDKTATFESGANVYFLSSANTYTKESAKLKVTNKGSVDADVTITASTAESTKMQMATSDTFTGNTQKELYLGLKVANQNAVAVKTTAADASPASVSVGLKGVEDNFEVKYNETTKKYSYEEKDGVPETAWNSFEFSLIGACNPNADWKDVEQTDAPTVTVTWAYDKRATDSTNTMLDGNATSDVAPSIATTTYTMTADTALVIPVDLGTKATAVSAVNWNGRDALATGTITYADSKVTVTAPGINYMRGLDDASQALEIVFNDSVENPTKITVTLNK